MSKIVFQIGILAFCISAVVFGLQGNDLFYTIIRSFIILVSVLMLGIIGLLFFAWFGNKEEVTPPPGLGTDSSGVNPAGLIDGHTIDEHHQVNGSVQTNVS